jgi:hypothetical protein
MTRLSTIDLMLVDDLFDYRTGYVLNFSNNTFERFFAEELGVEIYSDVFGQDGTSKGKRLGCYLRVSDPKDAAKALRALWDYRQALLTRSGEAEKVKDATARFFDLIRKLEGGTPSPSEPTPKPRVDKTLLDKLNAELMRVSMLAPQPRGYAFETFLKDLFNAYGMVARGSFRLIGEQIDGSFSLSDQPYLLEARWQNAPTNAGDLLAFNGKCENKADWTRGLFISQSGFTSDGLVAFGRSKRLVCMDGLDLVDTLRRGLHLQSVLLEKVRRAGETGAPFMRVRDIFPE